MSFLRNSDSSRGWQLWLRDHRDRLLAAGVPPLLLEKERRWWYFLEHGYFTPEGSSEPIISVERLPRSQAESLCMLLEQQERYVRTDVQNRLQFLLSRGSHSKGTSQEERA